MQKFPATEDCWNSEPLLVADAAMSNELQTR